jgi:2-methylcitrate dehydratase PrpD
MDGDTLTASFIAGTSWTLMPEDVREKAKMCLMDTLAATISGSEAEISTIATRFAAAYMPGEESTILNGGRKSTAAGAAFANGCAANGLDTDDGARYAYGHAGAQLFPAVLAISESTAAGGGDLLAAMVIGYEVAHRIGRCWHDHHQEYQACGSWGSVACAAAAASLLKLDVEQTKHALGIAEYHAPGLPMMRDIADPAMVKHGIGWGAYTGIVSARLASCGYTGIPTLLSFDRYRHWIEDIGKNYLMVDGVGWKAKGYACCGWAHAAVEGCKALVETHRIDPQRIEKIVVETFDQAAALGAKPPRTTEEAQFNLAWPVAAMLTDGEIGPKQMNIRRLQDPAIMSLASKVEIRETDEMNELRRLFELGDPRGRFASSVTVILENGESVGSGLVEGGFMYPPRGWSRTRMEEKFHWLADPLLGGERADRLVELVWRFDEEPDVGRLVGLATTGR